MSGGRMQDQERIGGLPRRFTKMAGAGNDFLVFQGSTFVGPRFGFDRIRMSLR